MSEKVARQVISTTLSPDELALVEGMKEPNESTAKVMRRLMLRGVTGVLADKARAGKVALLTNNAPEE
jgi:hypothetical protein